MRWANLFRSLGHQSNILTQYKNQICDLLIALHAVKSADSIERFHKRHPSKPCFVTLTGTDVFMDSNKNAKDQTKEQAQALSTMQIAARIIVLQSDMKSAIPNQMHNKIRVVYQSAKPAKKPQQHQQLQRRLNQDEFNICLLGHLRDVKDPFLILQAIKKLPQKTNVRIIHIGAALEQLCETKARSFMLADSRYHWLGELPRSLAMQHLAECNLLVMTSKSEGGPSAVSEALASDVPILSTRTSGVIGILGEKYPGLFDIGDADQLARLIAKCQDDAKFLQRLKAACASKKKLVSPAYELHTWEKILSETY